MSQEAISAIRASLPEDKRVLLDQINQLAAPALARTTNVLTGFTEHTLEHSLAIEKIYDILFRRDFEVLNMDERFFLIVATLLHDVGMVGSEEWVGHEGRLRNNHQSRSKEIIISNRQLFGLTKTQAEIIGTIAEAHRRVDLETLDIEFPYAAGQSIKVRFLAALLRFADELHVTDDRAPEFVTKLIKPNPLSLMHHERHQVISGINWGYGELNVIRIGATIDDWAIEAAVMEMISEIQGKLESVHDILVSNGIHIAAVEPQFSLGRLVRKEVLLDLSRHPVSCPIEDILTRLGNRPEPVVRQELNSLYDYDFIEKEGNEITLNTDIQTFTNVFNFLHHTQVELEFMKSAYVKSNVEAIFEKIALEHYAAHYKAGDKEDRLLLLANSPTALDILLNKQGKVKQFGHLNREAVLDATIMSNYLQDVSEFPEISAVKDESNMAMQVIADNLGKSLGPFINLLKAMDPATEEKKTNSTESPCE